MDHYIPKRRLPVTLWSRDVQGVSGYIFLDLDMRTGRHQTILDKLNEASPFLTLAVGSEGRTQLFHRGRLTRVTPGSQVIHPDVFARGFQPWREERAEVLLDDGARLEGHVWTPLERETQRLSDFMNDHSDRFFVLRTSTGIHLVNAAAVVSVTLEEGVGQQSGTECDRSGWGRVA